MSLNEFVAYRTNQFSRQDRKRLLRDISYLHATLPTGQRCTAAIVVEDKKVHLSIVLCSLKDNFSRREGRFRSLPRLANYLRGDNHPLTISFTTTPDCLNINDDFDLLRAIRMNKDEFIWRIYSYMLVVYSDKKSLRLEY